MTIIFPQWTNTVPAALAAGLLLGGVAVVFVVWYWFSPRHTDVGYAPSQPVLYSHKQHAGLFGIDCRYCHWNVEEHAHAGVPPTETCMGCHQHVLPESTLLPVLREKWQTGDPVPWIKVHMLPDYAYFHHGVHVKAGIGCASCHGRIDQMEVVRQAEPLNMGWCLECHRAPENHLRPYDQVTNMEYVPNPEEGRLIRALGPMNSAELAAARGKPLPVNPAIQPPTHCSACHR